VHNHHLVPEEVVSAVQKDTPLIAARFLGVEFNFMAELFRFRNSGEYQCLNTHSKALLLRSATSHEIGT
jgi:hypothetical protein